jgi:hypothetical protein
MSKPTKATVRQRVDDVLRIRLDGAEFHDVRRYAAEKQASGEAPWDSEKPVSDRTLWRYVAEASRLMAVSLETSRKKRLRVHLARRKALYARAVAAGDVRAALAVLDSQAKLEGLLDGELLREIEDLKRRLARLTGGDDGDGGDTGGATKPRGRGGAAGTGGPREWPEE